GEKQTRLAVAAKRLAKALLCVVSLAVPRQDQDMFRQLLRSPGESLFLYLCKEKVTKKKAQPGPRSGQLRWPVPCASRASGGRPATRCAQTGGPLRPRRRCDARFALRGGRAAATATAKATATAHATGTKLASPSP